MSPRFRNRVVLEFETDKPIHPLRMPSAVKLIAARMAIKGPIWDYPGAPIVTRAQVKDFQKVVSCLKT